MTIIHSDCVTAMNAMEPDSIDAICTDPPYGLEFMGKEWDKLAAPSGGASFAASGLSDGGVRIAAPSYTGSPNPNCQTCGGSLRGNDRAGGFTRCRCERPDFPNVWGRQAQAMQQWHQEWATAALRVAKPGAYLLAFGGTRTVHRMTVALEDAGWLIRDMLVWCYLSGFPKSRASLKPSWEPIVLARKPGPLADLNIDATRIPVGGPTAIMDAWEQEPNLCASCAADAGCRARLAAPATRASTTPRRAVQQPSGLVTPGDIDRPGTGCSRGTTTGSVDGSSSTAASGRTPTVLSLTGSSSTTSTRTSSTTDLRTCTCCGALSTPTTTNGTLFDTETAQPQLTTSESIDAGGRWPPNVLMVEPVLDGDWPGIIGAGPGQSRVFVLPKASRSDREPVMPGMLEETGPRVLNSGSSGRTFKDGEWVETHSEPRKRANHHPTVKPIELMRHLVRLVTPAGGTVLDPFLGSGTTALAAEQEGRQWVGIEREAEYVRIAEARLSGWQRGLGLE
jgi:DNA modification methylase